MLVTRLLGTRLPFAPLSAAPYQWIDPSDRTTIVSYYDAPTNTQPSAFNDKSGFGRIYSTSRSADTGVLTPLSASTSLTGLKTNSASYYYSAGQAGYAGVTYSITGTEMSLIGVMNPLTDTSNNRFHCFEGSGNDYGNAARWSASVQSGSWMTNSLSYPTSTCSQNTPFIYCAVFSKGSLSIWTNGGAATTATAAMSLNVTGAQWGYSTNVSSHITAILGENLIFNYALPTTTRQNLEGYLGHKWSISLASGHPWQSSAPTTARHQNRCYARLRSGLYVPERLAA